MRYSTTFREFLFCLLFVGLFCIPACNRQPLPNDLPKLYRRSVKVTQGGRPLADAVVFFAPTDNSKWNAGGSTNSSGVAELHTQGMYRGIAAGTYKVTVNKTEFEDKVDPTRRNSEGGALTTTIFHSLVELKYTDQNTTDLEVVITPKNEPIVLDLGSPVRQVLPE